MASNEQAPDAFWRRSVRLAALTVAVVGAALWALAPAGESLALGLVAGGATGVARFGLRYRAFRRMRSARSLVRSRLLAYALNAPALAAAFAFPRLISPWSTAAGLLVMNVCVLAAELLEPDRRIRHAAAAGRATRPPTGP